MTAWLLVLPFVRTSFMWASTEGVVILRGAKIFSMLFERPCGLVVGHNEDKQSINLWREQYNYVYCITNVCYNTSIPDIKYISCSNKTHGWKWSKQRGIKYKKYNTGFSIYSRTILHLYACYWLQYAITIHDTYMPGNLPADVTHCLPRA
jgi:hypothetical protein